MIALLAAYIARLLDLAAPRFVRLITVVTCSLYAAAAVQGPIRIVLLLMTLCLIVHLAVVMVLAAGALFEWRLPNAYMQNPNLLQRLFVQMGITGVALFLLPLEDLVRFVGRLRRALLA